MIEFLFSFQLGSLSDLLVNNTAIIQPLLTIVNVSSLLLTLFDPSLNLTDADFIPLTAYFIQYAAVNLSPLCRYPIPETKIFDYLLNDSGCDFCGIEILVRAKHRYSFKQLIKPRDILSCRTLIPKQKMLSEAGKFHDKRVKSALDSF